MNFARRLWQRLEPIHAVTYFAPEAREANKSIGLRGFWMGYFGSRAAPMGPVSAATVEATFYNFAPTMVRRAIPDAWAFVAAERILSERMNAATKALRRLASSAVDASADTALPFLRAAVEAASGAGRPLFAANQALPWPDHPVAGLWHAATCLREHRGDGHVALLVAEDLDGCEAHVMFVASEGASAELLRQSRGWSADDWAEAEERLRSRGLLDADGAITEAGRELRRRIEARTDELAESPFADLNHADRQHLLDAVTPVTNAIIDSGLLPYPNPIGLPRPQTR